MPTAVESTTPEDLSQALKTARLEQAYQKALQQAEQIYAEERARVLRVQLLLLEDDNDELQERIVDNSAQIDQLEDGNGELRQEVLELEASLQKVQADLKCRARDVERYRAEAESMSATSSDAARILKEKLALARELSALKPELEHFQSQVTTQQNTLAEKLSLQREVSALQVELETEKRAVQRIKSADKSTENNPTLSAEIDELKKELAKERREVQKAERESRKKMVEWESQKDALEGKLDAFRNKLRSTKEQLKEAQDELERRQAAQFAKSADLAALRATGAVNPRKRNVAHFDPDMTIGTPGHGAGRPATKRARTVKAASVEPTKPAFSITPFLNRTLSILPESPTQVDANISQHIDKIAAEAAQPSSPTVPAQEKQKEEALAHEASTEDDRAAKKSTAGPPNKPKARQAMKETTNAKANAAVQKARLPKVTEEEDEENAPTLEPPDFESDQPVKRQRVLGQTKRMFDGGESEAEKPKVRKLGLGLRGGGSSGFGDVSFMGGGGKALTAFSPLKKDRKAAA